MKPHLREILAGSHVAAVAIVVLLLWSIVSAGQALLRPTWRAVSFLITAVAIWDVPYIQPGLSFGDRLLLTGWLIGLVHAVATFAAAWLLSRWVYGVGPFRSLGTYQARLNRRSHA